LRAKDLLADQTYIKSIDQNKFDEMRRNVLFVFALFDSFMTLFIVEDEGNV
jgi:hypothetical protein